MAYYRPQKEDPNSVKLTAVGNVITYLGNVTTCASDLTTSKIRWNNVLSTARANYTCIDIKSCYICAPMDRYEYIRMKLTDFPEHVQQQYNIQSHSKNGYVYLEIWRSIYSLPQAGKLSNKYLQDKLRPHGYYDVSRTPGLWKHISRPIDLSLVVDYFGVKCVGEYNACHLINSLKEEFTIPEVWNWGLYYSINLKWDYNKRVLDISMPGYIQKQLQNYKHQHPSKPQYAPYPTSPRKYGAASQEPIPQDTSPTATEE